MVSSRHPALLAPNGLYTISARGELPRVITDELGEAGEKDLASWTQELIREGIELAEEKNKKRKRSGLCTIPETEEEKEKKTKHNRQTRKSRYRATDCLNALGMNTRHFTPSTTAECIYIDSTRLIQERRRAYGLVDAQLKTIQENVLATALQFQREATEAVPPEEQRIGVHDWVKDAFQGVMELTIWLEDWKRAELWRTSVQAGSNFVCTMELGVHIDAITMELVRDGDGDEMLQMYQENATYPTGQPEDVAISQTINDMDQNRGQLSVLVSRDSSDSSSDPIAAACFNRAPYLSRRIPATEKYFARCAFTSRDNGTIVCIPLLDPSKPDPAIFGAMLFFSDKAMAVPEEFLSRTFTLVGAVSAELEKVGGY